jgi:hypothetical protein
VGHVSFIDRRSVSRGARIAVSERTSEIGQSTDATRMPPLKGNAIGISSMLFYRKKLDFRSGRRQVQSFSSFLFETSNKSSQVFFVVYSRRVRTAFVCKKKNKKRNAMKKQVHDPGGPGSPAARKNTKNSAESRRKGREKEAKGGGPTLKAARKTTVRREGGETLSSWTYPYGKSCETLSKNVSTRTP